MNVTIYHNPKCSKSRKTLELLSSRGLTPTVVEYLVTPPDALTIKSILVKLNAEPREVMRAQEAPYLDLELANTELTVDELIEAMVNNPILIERPIVVAGERAVIGRPPENVIDLIEN